MKTQKPNAEFVWKQMEDQVVPRLQLGVIEHLIYCHLLRHTLLEGKRQFRFSIAWLGQNIRVCHTTARLAVLRLVELGVLRMIEFSKAGRLMEVRLPEEILAEHPLKEAPPSKPGHTRYGTRYGNMWPAPGADLEKQDFLRTDALRHAIHAREAGRCFYCFRQLAPHMKCLDHVVPLAQSGSNSYRKLVSSCRE